MNARILLAVALPVGLAVVPALLAGCPERKEMVEEVGGAPKAQVDAARQKLDRAERKLQENAAAAAAAAE